MLPNKAVEGPVILPGSSIPSVCTMRSFTSSSVGVDKVNMCFALIGGIYDEYSMLCLEPCGLYENLHRRRVPEKGSRTGGQAVGASLKDDDKISDFRPRKHDIVAQ